MSLELLSRLDALNGRPFRTTEFIRQECGIMFFDMKHGILRVNDLSNLIQKKLQLVTENVVFRRELIFRCLGTGAMFRLKGTFRSAANIPSVTTRRDIKQLYDLCTFEATAYENAWKERKRKEWAKPDKTKSWRVIRNVGSKGIARRREKATFDDSDIYD
jgi:hypothetical protein